MDNKTISLLNQLNADFYKTTAVDFDDSRHYFWAGWEKIPPLLDKPNLTSKETNNSKQKIRVADIGCGNGRFGEFLLEKLPNVTLSYTGIDGNKILLDFAENSLEGKIPALHLEQIDIITALQKSEDFLGEQNFLLIGSFGVFHHIPSYELRIKAVKYLLSKLEPEGYLVISLWQFMEFERFQKKVVNNHNFDLEKNDYILDWKRGKEALRYCHFYDEKEIQQLITDTNAKLVRTYRADGKEGTVNKYLVLQNKDN